jgi:putative SOS response-associated peptidase YedK
MLTCAPNDFMRSIHHRMPVILRDVDYATWLDPKSSGNILQSLLATRTWDQMQAVAIPKLKPDAADTASVGQDTAE